MPEIIKHVIKLLKYMKLSQFRFKLPEDAVALYPHSSVHTITRNDGTTDSFSVTRRDECRLMVLHKKSQTIDMYKKDADGNPVEGDFIDFRNVLDYFDEGDTFIFNDTKVFPRVFTVRRRRPTQRLRCFSCVSLMRRCAFGTCLWSLPAKSE